MPKRPTYPTYEELKIKLIDTRLDLEKAKQFLREVRKRHKDGSLLTWEPTQRARGLELMERVDAFLDRGRGEVRSED